MNKNINLFSLKELIAIGIGGMIGGGIFSVLGLAVKISGHAAPLAFLIAGLIALCAGYSYVKLALLFHSDGASFTYLEHAFPKLPNLAGILGWIIIVGYVGTLSLYAFTFGIYLTDLLGYPNSVILRSISSSFILIFFMSINLLGVRETGAAEDFVVYTKLIILGILGMIGFYSINTEYYTPFFNMGHASIFTAAAIIFVAYEGFQLITNAVCETKNPHKNIPKSIYLSIGIVTLIYVFLAIMSIGNLSLDDFAKHGEYALSVAVFPSLGKLGRILIDIAAIFATASAVNATLFGASRMSAEIATEKMMPRAFTFRNKSNIPWISLIIFTLSALIFAFIGNLETIATFSSLTFLIVTMGVSIANLKLFRKTKSNIYFTIAGLLLIAITTLMLTWHLAIHERNTLITTLAIYLALIAVELTVSKRRICFKQN